MLQMQKQKSKVKQDEHDEAVEAQTERSKEISDEAACCLAEIDSLLEECANRELTNEEIVEKGLPQFTDLFTDEQEDALDKAYGDMLDNKITRDEYSNSAPVKAYQEAEEKYEAAMERYIAAYEAVTGMKWDACTC